MTEPQAAARGAPLQQTADLPLRDAIRDYVGRQGGVAPLAPHLRWLESEAIGIMREAVATLARPVLLFSGGKDSTAMLHLARKAFYPAAPPFPFLHIATGWDFRDTLRFRDALAGALDLDLRVHTNMDGVRQGIDPLSASPALHAQVMGADGLKQALAHGCFDAVLGGGRRDEEKSRAKERIFSVRTPQGGWDPRQQRPELWNLYNTCLSPGQSVRIFPLSNWTEADIWTYIAAEGIPVVPLYFSAPRQVVRRHGALILVDDERLPVAPSEVSMQNIRFRTLGCYPVTAASVSTAADVQAILAELRMTRLSEREGRLIDGEGGASMERKKRDGYF